MSDGDGSEAPDAHAHQVAPRAWSEQDEDTTPTVSLAVSPAAAPRRKRLLARGPLVTRIVAGVVVLAVLGAVALVPEGDAISYQTTSDAAETSSQDPQVAVPEATLPNAQPAPAALPAPGPAGPAPGGNVPLNGEGGGPLPGGTDTTSGQDIPLSPDGGAAGIPGDETSLTGGLTGGQLPQQRPCSLGWPAPGPDQQGGLASLIGLAPLAGPFSSEAFALGSVYQPILQLAGPLLAEIEPIITRNLYWINPIIEEVQVVQAIVLEAILPYYGPYRQQLLDAEVELGRLLTPILQRLYATDAASCFVAWQAQIINRAKGKPIQVASLTRPGKLITLSPDH